MDTTHEPHLEKSYRESWVFAMALGAAIGFGAYVLPFDWMTEAGLGGTLIGFLVGGAMIGVIAVSYGYVVRQLPVTGGGVAYAYSALGRTHSFIASWAMTLGYACIVAANASAATLVFRVATPGLLTRIPLYDIAGWTIYLPEVVVSSALIILFAWLNSLGNVITGRFQYYAVVAMLAAVIIIAIWMTAYYLIEQPELAPMFPAQKSKVGAILAIVAFAPWAYVGFDSIPQLAGEFDFSPAKALKLLAWGVAAATFIYCAMMFSTTIAVGVNHEAYEKSGWPPAEAITDIMGPFGLVLMVVAVSMGVLTGLNGFLTASSRVLYVMGKSGLGPRGFATLSAKNKAPVTAIIFVAVISLISPWFGRAALLWVVDMSSAGITVAYFYASYCAYRIASRGFVRGMKSRTAKSTVQKVIGLLGCVLAIAFLGLLLIPGSPGALGSQSLIALAIWFVLGVMTYISRRKEIQSISEEELDKSILGVT